MNTTAAKRFVFPYIHEKGLKLFRPLIYKKIVGVTKKFEQ